MTKTIHEVKIGNQTISVRTTHTEAGMQKVLDLVNTRLSEVQDRSGGISQHQALLLTILHLAEDVVHTKQKTSQIIDVIEQKAKKAHSALKSSFYSSSQT